MSAKPKDPMRAARADAVKRALEYQVPFCVLSDYRIVALHRLPQNGNAIGVAYPTEYRFVYCDAGHQFSARHLTGAEPCAQPFPEAGTTGNTRA